jgi:WD40 repeat protein
LFRGELDWIVMKALEKTRTRRYDTPQALASDVTRYLANEPIEARAPTAGYRMSKFVKRHTWGARVAAVVMVILACSTILIWNEQRQREASRRQAVANLADMYVTQGLAPHDLNGIAALWFAQAAVTARDDPARLNSTLIRLNNALRGQWVPVAAVHAPGSERLEFAPGNARYLITYPRNYDQGAPARVWDLMNEKELALPPGLEPLGAATWVSGGKLLLGSSHGPVVLLSMPDLKVLRRWDAGGPVKYVAANVDGSLVAATSGKKLLVWTTASSSLPEIVEHSEEIVYVAFAQKEPLLVTATEADAKARVFSVEAGEGTALRLHPAFPAVKHVYRIEPSGWHKCPPAFADNDHVLVTIRDASTMDRAGTMEWHELPSGMLRSTNSLPLYYPSDMNVSPDSKTVVITSIAGDGLTFDASAPQVPSTFPSTHSAVFDRTGRFIVTDYVQLHSFAAGRIGTAAFPAVFNQGGIGLSEGAKFMAVSGNGVWVVVYKSPASEQTEHEVKLNGKSTWAAFLPPDGAHVMPIGITDGSSDVRKLQVFESATGLPAGAEMDLGGRLVGAEPSPNGRWIATVTGMGDDPRRLRIWDWVSGKQVGAGCALDAEPVSVAYAPDGQAVAVHCIDGKVFLFDPANGHVLRRVQCAEGRHGAYPWTSGRGSIRFSRNSQTFFTWGSNIVEAWDRATGKLRYPLTHNDCWALAESPNGQLLATAGSDDFLRLWNTRDGTEARPPLEHAAPLYRVAFSPNGQYLYASGLSQPKVWNVQSGQLVCALANDVTGDAIFTPDSRRVVTFGFDRYQVWDLPTGLPMTSPIKLRGNSLNNHIEISPPDGHWLALSGSGAAVSIVDLTQLMTPAVQSPEEALSWCELLSNSRINGATMVDLTINEWIERWRRCKSRHPETQLSPSDFLPPQDNNSQ